MSESNVKYSVYLVENPSRAAFVDCCSFENVFHKHARQKCFLLPELRVLRELPSTQIRTRLNHIIVKLSIGILCTCFEYNVRKWAGSWRVLCFIAETLAIRSSLNPGKTLHYAYYGYNIVYFFSVICWNRSF